MPIPLELRRVVSPDASFRILNGEQVEVAIGGRVVEIPRSVHHLLLEFAVSRSASEVYAHLELDLPPPAFAELIGMLDGAGVLVLSDPDAIGAEPDEEFVNLVADGLLNDDDVRDAVTASLLGGRAVTISDALDPDFAETLHHELSAVTQWQPFEGAVGSYGFHFRHHNLVDEAQFPPAVRRCARLFGNARTKALLARLSGADCAGETHVGASAYLPGDYSLPHSDSSVPRTVAFVLHLTKDWDPAWGGGLFWCPSGIQLLPTFNRLTIFNVTPTSTHFVTPVSAHATGRRLAINGWWTQRRQAPPPARAGAPGAELPTGFVGACYGASPRVIGGTPRIVAL